MSGCGLQSFINAGNKEERPRLEGDKFSFRHGKSEMSVDDHMRHVQTLVGYRSNVMDGTQLQKSISGNPSLEIEVIHGFKRG